MKQLGNWFNPKYLYPLAIMAGVIWLISLLRKTILKGSINLTSSKNGMIDPEGIAEIQFSCMKNIGTDTTRLFSSLEGLTKKNLEDIFKAFGKKKYGLGGYDFYPDWLPFSGSLLDLFGWYSEELDESEKKLMREIWKITNLKITF